MDLARKIDDLALAQSDFPCILHDPLENLGYENLAAFAGVDHCTDWADCLKSIGPEDCFEEEIHSAETGGNMHLYFDCKISAEEKWKSWDAVTLVDHGNAVVVHSNRPAHD